MTDPRPVTLADIRRNLDEVRAKRGASPLGRYAAGHAHASNLAAAMAGKAEQAVAEADADRVVRDDVQDLQDALVLADVLAAVVVADEGRALELLGAVARRDPHLLTAVQFWADRLATLAARAGARPGE